MSGSDRVARTFRVADRKQIVLGRYAFRGGQDFTIADDRELRAEITSWLANGWVTEIAWSPAKRATSIYQT